MFPEGHGGLTGPNGPYRWTGFGLTMQEIVKTLSFHLGVGTLTDGFDRFVDGTASHDGNDQHKTYSVKADEAGGGLNQRYPSGLCSIW